MHQRVGPPETGSPGGVVDRLTGFGSALSGLIDDARMWALSDTEVLDGLDAAYRLATQAHTMALLLLAEADGRGLPQELGAVSTVAWLTGSRRVRPGDAKRDVALA